MLTLLDLHNQEFRRAFRGYDCEEVDTYMVQVIESYEIMTRRADWSLEQGVPVTAEGKRLLSPLEIHNQEFKRKFRGYDMDHVNDFLDRVIQSMEQLIQEKDNS
ncbi:DivIVA domain-containing protein [Kroppenstedtia eburnea]|uniref:DivIVA domain-containing protein n=1 Tax=Kroppenstedtia eburnea TaxID=714067 RepID=A0A1N7LFZ9_9BACL|nr:DivIVA domain-containing protein [Kroppenstedtia eburnea]SIS72750.1 DivIVA domain-containing protein [Kroppenstedtia eburnea]